MDLIRHTGGSAALFGQFRAFDGRTGKPVSFADVVGRCRSADVVLFGESHNDSVCNQFEAQLLHALATANTPMALAMEFFETDTQSAVDAYLAGRIEESAFREQARQKRGYFLSHRPLIELCRQARVPVIAANAPRRLIREYRKSGLLYDGFRASLSPEDRRWLPMESEEITGPYRDRFMEIMRDHPQPAPTSAPASQPATTQPAEEAESDAERAAAGFRTQLLWDDTMAESVACFRGTFPRHRVMLVVGSFHVAHEGGTLVKLRRRRTNDRIATIVYRSSSSGPFAFDEEDRNAGDVVIYGIRPPPKEPTSQPATPTTMPTTTAPAD